MTALSYAVGNVKNNPEMPQAHVQSDISRLALMHADITAGAEIMPRRYKAAWRATFAGIGRRTYNLSSECPVSTALAVDRSWVRKLVDGVARITPSRYNSVVRFPSENLVVIAKHPVSGSKRKGAAARRTVGMAVRRRLFARDVAKTRRRVRTARAHGRDVVILGDLNAIHAPVYGVRQVDVMSAGLMHIVALPAAGHTVAAITTRRIPAAELHTDHAFIGATFEFRGKA